MMKYDDLYFASRYNFFTDCVEWYFLPKTEIKMFLKKMDIRGFGWRPSICIISRQFDSLLSNYLQFAHKSQTIQCVSSVIVTASYIVILLVILLYCYLY